MKFKFSYIIIIIIIVILTALVVILYSSKKQASDYSDLVMDFYNIKPLDITYSSYNPSQPGHIQPVLIITEPGINDISGNFFLYPLFYSKRIDMDINNVNLRSMGILKVSYSKGTNKKHQSFVRITTNDNVVYFKHVVNMKHLEYDSYYPGIEVDILKYLGNEDWYSFSSEK